VVEEEVAKCAFDADGLVVDLTVGISYIVDKGVGVVGTERVDEVIALHAGSAH
jgi:hypothetical protein